MAKALSGPSQELDEAIDDAYGQVLGHHREFLDVLDPPSLAHLLGSDDRVRALAKLTALDLERTTDESIRARLRRRALGLLDALRAPTGADSELRRAVLAGPGA